MRFLQLLASNGALAGHRSRTSWPVTVVAYLPVSLPSFLISFIPDSNEKIYRTKYKSLDAGGPSFCISLYSHIPLPVCTKAITPFVYFIARLRFVTFMDHVRIRRAPFPRKTRVISPCVPRFSLRRRANRSRSKYVPR